MRAAALCLAGLLACLPALPAEIGTGPHPLDGTVGDLSSGTRIDAEMLAERLRDADAVVLGEIHDNPAHHLAQAQLIGALRPAGIAFEMIAPEQEPAIAAHLGAGGEPEGIGQVVGWDESGWPAWEMYRPVFRAWRARLYTGGGVGRERLREAVSGGAAALSPDPRLTAMLSRPLDGPAQTALENEMIAAHCDRLPREAATGMVEMQRLRDAALAAATLRAHEAGGPTVLVTGNGHARTDRGVPAYLQEAAPGLVVRSVGMVETRPGAEALSDYDLPFDHVWFTAPAERPDPCASFRQGG